jgi:putative hemolysin
VIGILYNKGVFKALQEKVTFGSRIISTRRSSSPAHSPSRAPQTVAAPTTGHGFVVNEFSEVEGLATLELLEEIVGEIRDEYDREERGPVERLPDGSMVIQGSTLLKELKSDYGLPFEESPDYLTLAGFVLAQLKRIPRGSERVEYNGYRLTIVDMEGRRIVKIKLEETKPVEPRQ